MKKLALFAFAAFTFTAISCKKEAFQPEVTTPENVDSSIIEVPSADSVEGVTVDSSKMVNSAEVSKDSVLK